ncbi:cupin domain-containing protein [Flavobacterium sp. SM15]|uniref:cupin domain-containing protein n=1 Tax=Flavobacterium sp. SM15 TaxID=2908005 RepID=UPI001EDB8214|nr:cupin domain-containing protein [Flavobacterium sp. SM15]MCG2611700.1 cupin domain-containing protein [Flavobacterium sp. SM15]
MKNVLQTIAKGTIVFLLFSTGLLAQDMKHDNHKMGHDLADNKILHAVEVTLQPGEKTGLHTHPAHFFYALSDGKLLIHYQDGKDELMELKTGENGYSEPERPHMTENVGTAPVKFLLVELKEHPYKPEKAKK